jgi:hypothetical protein
MNSDFIQVEAEALAKRVSTEPDNPSRIRKAYMLAYGREPSAEELKLGIDYVHAEPLREYEENKNKPPEPGAGRGGRGRGAGAGVGAGAVAANAAPTPAAEGGGADGAAGAMPMGAGMMAGMGGRGGRGGRGPVEVKYEPTAWGRYAKVLFSSSEFLFIN